MPEDLLPLDVKLDHLTMACRYKRDEKGNIAKYKAGSTLLGDSILENVHNDPDNTKIGAYAADKTTCRTDMAITRRKKQPTRHIDFFSAFTSQKYSHHHPVFVKHLSRFNGFLTDPGRPVDRLVLNLYRSRTVCHTYTKGLHDLLISNGYYRSHADPCLYFRDCLGERIVEYVKIDDFVVTVPTDEIIDEFIKFFKSKYKITDLRRQQTFIGGGLLNMHQMETSTYPNLF